MENVYDLHQHTHCVVINIGKYISTSIFSTSNRRFDFSYFNLVQQGPSIPDNKKRTYVGCLDLNFRDEIVIDSLQDALYNLFRKDKRTWDEDDRFLMKAVSDYLPAAVKDTIKGMKLKIESFDLLHYAFIVPSEWEEEIRDEMVRPLFVQSGLISKEDHQDRLLFFTDIESICYKHSFERGQNTIFCRLFPSDEKILIKFDLIQTTTTLFNYSNTKLIPKVTNSSSVSVTKGAVQGRIKDFLRENLFPVVNTDNDSVIKPLNPKLAPSDQDQMIEAIIKGVYSWLFPSLDNENVEKNPKDEPWIIFKKSWMLSESQKEFIESLCPSIICAEIGTFLLGHMKYIIQNNFTKSYGFLLYTVDYDNKAYSLRDDIKWLNYILEYNRRSLNDIVKITMIISKVLTATPNFLLEGAGRGVFDVIQHSDIYCKPRIIAPVDLSTSSSVFHNSKPDAIVNLDILLGSTLFTCSLLDKDGYIQQIFDRDYFIKDKHLPPLGHFYSFSNTITLHVKEQFISFAERFLLGDLNNFIVKDGVSIRRDILLEMKNILINNIFDGEVLVSTDDPKYIKAFILMYMVYIKQEILYKLPDQLISDQMDMKTGYTVSIEAVLLNNTVESKENLRDIIHASGLVPKDDNSKKLRIITQGERCLPAIQKSLKLELPLKSYFLLCQLHEDYVQLSLFQVVTAFDPEENEQESILVQDEVISIHNIYDSLCSSICSSLQQDSSLIELCEMHNTSDDNKIRNIFSSKVKAELFANLKNHILDNVLQNNSGTKSTPTINLTSSCNCKARLTTSDIIDISFTPVLQDIACILSASLLNKELFGNYMNIDYLFSFIRFNNNPQLQYSFARILEKEADDFNLELGIDTSCLVVPEIFSQLLQPVIAQRAFCYKDFKIGVLQQVCSENYVVRICQNDHQDEYPIYKSKITDTKTIQCSRNIVFPCLDKGDVINNVRLNRKFYLRNEKHSDFHTFGIDIYRFKTMNYLEDNETLSSLDNIYECVDFVRMNFGKLFELKNVDIPINFSISYLSYVSSLQFSIKLAGADTRDEKLMGVIETGEPLTLTRF